MSTEIDVRNQARLSLTRIIRLVIKGIKHRLFRSTMTMAVILLAVAFFMFMLTESGFIKSTGRALNGEIGRNKAPARELKLLFSKPSRLVFLRDLTALSPREAKILAARTSTAEADLERLCQQAGRIQTYMEFFEKMDIGKRLSLVGQREGLDMFRPLVEDAAWKHFLKTLDPMHSLKIPGGAEEFRGFLDQLDNAERSLAALHDAWLRRVAEFRAHAAKMMGGTAPEVWLRTADPAGLAAFLELSNQEGFLMTPPLLEGIQQYLRDQHLRGEMIARLASPEGRKRWAERFRAWHSLDEKLRLLCDPRAKEVLSGFAPADVDRVYEQIRYEKRLESLSSALHGKAEGEGEALLSSRQIFLLVVSLIVCMVGIANAMLMAITERFREIATMKCLGATDGFILQQFLIEAAIQGVAGGLLGMVIGLALSFLKNAVIFGSFMVMNISWPGVLFAALISLAAGILLSMFASIYPSWSASRMAPMDAMRVE